MARPPDIPLHPECSNPQHTSSAAGENSVLTAVGKKRIMDRLTGCSAVGSALGSGPRGPGFKSPHSDHAECPYGIWVSCNGHSALLFPIFYFPQSSYRKAFRGVAECCAFSCFHDHVGRPDIPAARFASRGPKQAVPRSAQSAAAGYGCDDYFFSCSLRSCSSSWRLVRRRS